MPPLPYLLAALTIAGVAVAPSAAAEPGTPVTYPSEASATRFTGLAFDACDAPDIAALKAWKSSPYRALGVYTSGDLRACGQHRLTADWVDAATALGWKLIPLDVGLQAPCAYNAKLGRMSADPTRATEQGARAATGAIDAAAALGMLPGSALYADLEPFRTADSGCVEAVRSYLSGWTRTLHDGGYLAGAYGALTAGLRTQSASYGSDEHARLDAVWSAEWNGTAVTKKWAGLPDKHWPVHQRIKQYRGDHDEVHGGYLLNIDSNAVDAPVATVARKYTIAVESVARLQPDELSASTTTVAAGTEVRLVCRTDPAVGAWSKLADGTYLPAAATPKARRLGVCTAPFQLAQDADGKHGPGALAWATCETPDVTGGDPDYWLRLESGEWIAGSLTTRPDPAARQPAVPLCTSFLG